MLSVLNKSILFLFLLLHEIRYFLSCNNRSFKIKHFLLLNFNSTWLLTSSCFLLSFSCFRLIPLLLLFYFLLFILFYFFNSHLLKFLNFLSLVNARLKVYIYFHFKFLFIFNLFFLTYWGWLLLHPLLSILWGYISWYNILNNFLLNQIIKIIKVLLFLLIAFIFNDSLSKIIDFLKFFKIKLFLIHSVIRLYKVICLRVFKRIIIKLWFSSKSLTIPLLSKINFVQILIILIKFIIQILLFLNNRFLLC